MKTMREYTKDELFSMARTLDIKLILERDKSARAERVNKKLAQALSIALDAESEEPV